MTEEIPASQSQMQQGPLEMPEHTYVAWTYGEDTAFEAELRRPDLAEMVSRLLGIVLFSVLLSALLAPWIILYKHGFGLFFLISLVGFIAALYSFWKLLPPPFRATNRMRRVFIRGLRKKNLQRVGLNRGAIVSTVLGEDGDTLEITVTDDWLKESYEKRLRDAQKLWRFWAEIYSPYDGWDKALILLRDRTAKHVGGSKPHVG